MGFIGFFVKLLFIPINNIIMGPAMSGALSGDGKSGKMPRESTTRREMLSKRRRHCKNEQRAEVETSCL